MLFSGTCILKINAVEKSAWSYKIGKKHTILYPNHNMLFLYLAKLMCKFCILIHLSMNKRGIRYLIKR